MNNSIVIAAVVVLIVVIAAFFLMRGSKTERLANGDEGDGVLDGAAAAIEDVAGPLFGVDAHPDLAGPADDLTTLKGLGPKAAAQLNAIGITRFAQLASLTTAQEAAIDVRMGTFQGRITRDKWVEQATYLAKGDRATFEEKFGKLMS